MKLRRGRPTKVAQRRILILVENLPSPFDRRVWQEATTLNEHGYQVCIVCPTGKGYDSTYETVDGIHIYRYVLGAEGDGPLSYIREYGSALFHSFRLSIKVRREFGFDAIHACNPPDLLFIVGAAFKALAGTKFLFDHHDINPELYEAKFGRRGLLWRLMIILERATFRIADVSIATNESYRTIAIERGRMDSERVFVVRSGPKLDRLKLQPPNLSLKNGRKYLVGYVGVMGRQEGIDYLLRAAHHIVHILERRDVQFTLVGGGTSLSEMRSLSADLNLESYVTFTGRVSDEVLLDVLNTADVCVNPDVANEMNDKSTMNKIMEYMALGKPIVQFDLAEGRVSAQQASVYAEKNDYVDLAAKILDLLSDENKRVQMGLYGRARVENVLEWKYEAPKLLSAYDALFD